MAYSQNQYRARSAHFPRPQASAGPRTFPARFDSVCPKCRQPIVADETLIIWAPGQKAVHAECPVVAPIAPVFGADAQGNDTFDPNAAFAALRGKLEVEDAGVYVLPDGTIVKVQANKEKTRVYAKKWIIISGERLTEADTREHGEYEYTPGLLPQVEREGVRMTIEQAKAFTLRFGICARCGRHLKAAESVERGIGPVCWKWFEGGHSH